VIFVSYFFAVLLSLHLVTFFDVSIVYFLVLLGKSTTCHLLCHEFCSGVVTWAFCVHAYKYQNGIPKVAIVWIVLRALRKIN